jgi:hypothetical protein
METFILKLAVAVIPLVVLITSVTLCSCLSSWHSRHSQSTHRRRRSILRAIAAGVMLR